MRRRRKYDIVIELTALLDVIMILIFMVMKENSKLIVEKQNALEIVQQVNIEQSEKIDELAAQLDGALEKLSEGNLDEILERLQAAETMLEGYRALDNVVVVINVTLENQSSNTIRRLTFGNSADLDLEPTAMECRSNDEFNVAVNRLRVFISDNIRQTLENDSDSTIVCIVFSYDPEKVFQRDYESIHDALRSIESAANNANLRYRVNPSS